MFRFQQKNFLMGLILLCASASSATNAELVSGNAGTITEWMVYTNIGEGDFLIQSSIPLQDCDGFFVYGSDPGSKNVYTILQAAYLTRKEVYLWADNSRLWEGSSSRYCHIYAVNYVDG